MRERAEKTDESAAQHDVSDGLQAPTRTPPDRVNRFLRAFVVVGLVLSSAGVIVEALWKSLNGYEQSGVLSKTIGRQPLVWDLRTTNKPNALGKPMHVHSNGGDVSWTWSGPTDVKILLPGDRELITDSLDISASIERGQVMSISINGGSLLGAADMRTKMLAEIRSLKPNHRGDGVDCEWALNHWYENPNRSGSVGTQTAIWSLSGKPRVIARISDLSGKYIVQYELSWY